MIPWGQIISASITLADVANNLYRKTRKNSSDPDKKATPDIHLLLRRIEEIESMQTAHADFLQKMADHHQVLIKKTRVAYFIAIASLLFAAFLLFAVLFVYDLV